MTCTTPNAVGFFDTGGRGVHRIVYEGGDLAYISATPDGYTGRIWLIVDVSDPANPTEVGRWWWPGMWESDGEILETPDDKEWLVHHAMVHDDRAYLGFWDGGMVVIDISDPTSPTTISRLGWEEGGTPTPSSAAGPRSGGGHRRGDRRWMRRGPAHGQGGGHIR